MINSALSAHGGCRPLSLTNPFVDQDSHLSTGTSLSFRAALQEQPFDSNALSCYLFKAFFD